MFRPPHVLLTLTPAACTYSEFNNVNVAECQITATQARAGVDDPGAMGLSSSDAAALWSLDQTVRLVADNAWFTDRDVDGRISLTATGPGEEVEQTWGPGEPGLEESCPATTLNVPVHVDADIDTVGTATGVATLVVLDDGTAWRLQDPIDLSGTTALASELEDGRNTTCSSLAFSIALDDRGWSVHYAADCDDARSGGLLLRISDRSP